jgi:hypothetical protein
MKSLLQILFFDFFSKKLSFPPIIETVDHILNNDLVHEHPAAAKYVAEIELKMQEIKEDFTKEVISIVGSKIGKDNELCFTSFKNKTTKQVQKRHKSISG